MDVRAKVGVIGGTFDPIHVGHLIAAEEARVRLGLGEVLFAPAGDPWHRGGRSVSEAKHRIAMVERSIATNPHFRLSTVDIDRVGPTFTVDTIAALRHELGETTEIYFILGMDSVADLPTWKEPARLLKLCRLVAMPRPGYETFDVSSLEKRLPGVTSRFEVLPMPLIGISSTDIRRRVRSGLPIEYQVLPKVQAYIAENGLYKDSV